MFIARTTLEFFRYSQRTYLKLLNLEPDEREQQTIPLKQYELEAQVLAHHWFWAVDPHSTFDSIKVGTYGILNFKLVSYGWHIALS